MEDVQGGAVTCLSVPCVSYKGYGWWLRMYTEGKQGRHALSTELAHGTLHAIGEGRRLVWLIHEEAAWVDMFSLSSCLVENCGAVSVTELLVGHRHVTCC